MNGLLVVVAMVVHNGQPGAAIPEICAASPVIQARGPILVYGDGFDGPDVRCGVLWRAERPDEKATDDQLRQWLDAHLAGAVQLPADGWQWLSPLAGERHRLMIAGSPSGGAPAGPVGLRIRCGHAESDPYVANRPEIWAASPLRPSPGGVCQFWGVNLGGKAALVDPSGKIAVLAEARQGYHEHSKRIEDAFFREFLVPASLPAGHYRLYNWSGLGAAGWSDGLEVEIAAPPPVPRRVVNVRAMGAEGDSVRDDTEAFEKAIASLAATGGRVFVPPGCYRFTRCLTPPSNVEIVGVSAEASVLAASAADDGQPFQTPPRQAGKPIATLDRVSPMVWLRSGCALRGLTLEGSGAGVPDRFALVLIGEVGRTCRDAAVLDCRLVASQPYLAECAGIVVAGGPGPTAGHAGIVSDSLRVEGCRLAVNSTGLRQIKDGRNVGSRICRNTFTAVPPHGAHALLISSANQGCLFEANVFEHGGRVKTEQGPRPSAGHGTIRHNCWRLNVLQNNRKHDGETIMYETGSPGWYGKAGAASAETITAADPARFWPDPDRRGAWRENEFAGGYCVVVEGRGLGQWAFVRSNTADTLRLDRRWRILPDATTTFSVLCEGSVENVHVSNDILWSAGYSGNYRTSLRNVWAQNESEGHTDGLKFWNTSSPSYVTAMNVALGERYHSRGGIEVINSMKFYQEQSSAGRPAAIEPDNPWHRQWLEAMKSSRRVFGNEIRSCIVCDRHRAVTDNGGLYTGSIRLRLEKHGLRPERLAGIALTTLMGWPTVPDEPAEEVEKLPKTTMSWNLLYDNLLWRCPVGIRLSPASSRNFALENQFVQCPVPVLDLGRDNFVTRRSEDGAGSREEGRSPPRPSGSNHEDRIRKAQP